MNELIAQIVKSGDFDMARYVYHNEYKSHREAIKFNQNELEKELAKRDSSAGLLLSKRKFVEEVVVLLEESKVRLDMLDLYVEFVGNAPPLMSVDLSDCNLFDVVEDEELRAFIEENLAMDIEVILGQGEELGVANNVDGAKRYDAYVDSDEVDDFLDYEREIRGIDDVSDDGAEGRVVEISDGHNDLLMKKINLKISAELANISHFRKQKIELDSAINMIENSKCEEKIAQFTERVLNMEYQFDNLCRQLIFQDDYVFSTMKKYNIPKCEDLGFFYVGVATNDPEKFSFIFCLNKDCFAYYLIDDHISFITEGNTKYWRQIENWEPEFEIEYPQYIILLDETDYSDTNKFSDIFNNESFSEDSFRKTGDMISNLILCISDLHENNIYDCLISHGNLDHQFTYRFSPFTKLYHASVWKMTSSQLTFLSPDSVRSPASDIYSLGMLIISCFCKKPIQIPSTASKYIIPTLWSLKPSEDTIHNIIELVSKCCGDIELRPSILELKDLFREIYVDSIIHDLDGARFWKEHYLHRSVVPMHQMIDCFVQYFNVEVERHHEVKVRAFGRLLNKGQSGDRYAYIEEFSRVLYWFGPVDNPDEQFPLLTRIEKQLAKHAFHGPITASDALQRLAMYGKKKIYLIRFSGTVPGCYAVSLKDKNSEVIHYRVMHSPGSDFVATRKHYNSLEECTTGLVKGYQPVKDGTYGDIYSSYMLENPEYERDAFYSNDRRN